MTTMELPDIGAFVDTFLDGEKDGARRLIRHEMESMIDPLVESLFGQLKAKFVDYVDIVKSQELQLLDRVRYDNGQMIRGQETITNAQKYHSQSLPIHSLDNVNYSIDANSQINTTNNHKPTFMSIKEKINDSSNEFQFEPQLNDHLIINSSSSSEHESSSYPESMNRSTSTDHSLANNEIQKQLVDIRHNQFDDDEECDCDECVYGGIEVKEEVDDDDDGSVYWIQDYQEDGLKSSPPLKRPRIDTTQNQTNAQTDVIMLRQFPRQPTDDEQQPNEVNYKNKHYSTLSLQCPKLNCLKMFAVNELNDHLMDEHSIGPNGCLVKDCAQSFHNPRILSEHIKQDHHGITQWNCGKCVKHFTKYPLLSIHYTQQHQLGQFECSFPSCTFKADCRPKVYTHYTTKHRPTHDCRHFGCHFQTPIPALLKTHERIHLGIKPYRCKWPNCHYAGNQKEQTIIHIHRHHLARNASSVPNGSTQLDPNDYLEVMHDLL